MMKTAAAIALFLATSLQALAFPSWIGVYGNVQRHDGNNPGTFTVLMNQDYYGLRAEVGVQVNGGAWQTYAMSYAGKVDNNSKWTFAPAAAFPVGATVKYYFHGFDSWGGHIWDSASGQNYTFTVPAPAFSFRAPRTVIEGSAGAGAAAQGTIAFIAHATPTSGAVRVCSMTSTAAVETVTLTPSVPNDADVAASDMAVMAALAVSNQVQVYCSLDAGASFSPMQPVTITTDGTHIIEIDIEAIGPRHFAVACRAGFLGAGIWFTRTLDGGASWSTPSLVDAAFFAGDVHIGGDGSTYTLAYTAMPGQRQSDLRVATSSDGATWSRTNLYSVLGGGSVGRVDLVASVSSKLVLLDNGTTTYRFWNFANGAWRSLGNVTAAVASDTWPSRITELFDGRLVHVGPGPNGAVYRISSNGGANWSAASDISGITPPLYRGAGERYAGYDLIGAMPVPGALQLAWHRLETNGTHAVALQGTARPALQWVGNTDQWPLNGDLDAGEGLWINTETWPKGGASGAFVAYTVDGVNWYGASMSLAGDAGNNDWWHVNIGSFSSGTTVRYAIAAMDEFGALRWDNNNGLDYTTRVK